MGVRQSRHNETWSIYVVHIFNLQSLSRLLKFILNSTILFWWSIDSRGYKKQTGYSGMMGDPEGRCNTAHHPMLFAPKHESIPLSGSW